MPPLVKSETFSHLPPEWPENLLPVIRGDLQTGNTRIVVLDDDPTGTQTVHHVSVLTHWGVTELVNELQKPGRIFYLLTNSRGLQPEESRTMTLEIGRNLHAAALATHINLIAVSRSDSTLRGHFPLEIDALAEGLAQKFDACLVIPFFLEGGRFTLDNVHYVAQGDTLTPAGETEFARDATFGYRSSNLCDWVQEKTSFRVLARDVAVISLADLRLGGPDKVFDRLMELDGFRMCVVNAAAYRDLEVLVAALFRAEARGKRYIFRSAASFVRVLAGISLQDLLDREAMHCTEPTGGVIIIGSHVPRTTAQLKALQAKYPLVEIEISVQGLLEPQTRTKIIVQTVDRMNQSIQAGLDVLVYTSRQVIEGRDGRQSLEISRLVSTCLIEIVQQLSVRPRFLVVKGGITSSDIATQGLQISRAEVLGQILPGIPVWLPGEESKYPGLPFIIFPGNVGNDQALVEIFEKLSFST